MSIQNSSKDAEHRFQFCTQLRSEEPRWSGFDRDELIEIYHTCELIRSWSMICISLAGHDFIIVPEHK